LAGASAVFQLQPTTPRALVRSIKFAARTAVRLVYGDFTEVLWLASVWRPDQGPLATFTATHQYQP
jgi:hypothetical protein